MTYIGTKDFGLEVLKGRVGNHTVKTIYGRNPDIDIASGYETIWNGGGIYTGQNATGAEIVQVYSDSASDTAAGTGARTIFIKGLSSTGAEQSETVTLNGVTAVDTVLSYWRLPYGDIMTAGSTGSNVGKITARQKVSTSNIFFNMPATYNHTAVCAYTIPLGKKGYLKHWGASVVSKMTSTCEIHMMTKMPGEVWHTEEVFSARDGFSADRLYQNYFDEELPALTDMRLDTNTDANNTVIAGYFSLILVTQ